jgi:hemolysin activation/secretion protein
LVSHNTLVKSDLPKGPLTAFGFATGLFALSVATSGQVSAQALPNIPSQADISRERVPLPPVEEPEYKLRIQSTDKSAVSKSIDSVEFQINDVVVQGATAFPPDEIEAFFAEIEGKKVGLGAVRDAANQLEQHYRAHGLFLTRVFIPPQQISNDTIIITVVEGYIEDITIEGLDESTRASVRAALEPLLSHKPIDLPSMERRLLILNDLPGVSANSVLRPGQNLGGSSMIVKLDRPKNFYLASIDNGGSRILGPWNYSVNANVNRPLNLPGALSFGLSSAGPRFRALKSLNMRYSGAIGTHGLTGSIGALVAKARPGGSVKSLDIVNDALSISGRLRYPIIRSRALSLFVEGGVSVNRSDTDILGQRVTSDRTTVGDVGLTLQQNGWLNGSTTFKANIFQGLPLFKARERSDPLASVAEFDPNFTRLTYSIQRTQHLSTKVSLVMELKGQYTKSKLLSGELIAFGGAQIGRGFDPSAITGDRGLGGRAELRYNLKIPIKWASRGQLYGFADTARTTNIATTTGPKLTESIRSVGGGLRVYHRYGVIDTQLAYGHNPFGGPDDRPNPRVLISASFFY